MPLEDLMAQIAVFTRGDHGPAAPKRRALSVCLPCYASTSNACWEEASDMAQDIGLPEAAVTEMMNKATKWADELPVSFAK